MTWHLIGTGEPNLKYDRWLQFTNHKLHLFFAVLVLGSFPFIYSRCLGCEDSSTWSQFAYFSFFIVVFQFGWAAVQVAHMSLITDLSPNSNERVLLNSLRQAATVAASVTVYSVVLVLFGLHQDQSSLSKEHLGAFTVSFLMPDQRCSSINFVDYELLDCCLYRLCRWKRIFINISYDGQRTTK